MATPQSTRLLERLQRAQADGHLPSQLQPQALAAMFGSIIAGLAVLAKSGAGAAKPDMVTDMAMAVWPMEQRKAA